MTNPKPNAPADELLETFRNDFNHIVDGRILVEPRELASYIQAYCNERVREARIDELRELEALPNVYPEKIRGQYTHVEAIYKSAITNRIAELQSTKEDKSNR